MILYSSQLTFKSQQSWKDVLESLKESLGVILNNLISKNCPKGAAD